MQLIGIAGKKGSGKTTLARRVTRQEGYYDISFADPIRAACDAMFEILLPHSASWYVQPKHSIIPALGKSRREIEQALGTEWGRKLIHPNIWCIIMHAQIESLAIYNPKRIVIDDVRFENEAALIRSMGGTIIHLQRPCLQEVDPHPSEAGIAQQKGDPLLMNDGSKEELFAKADRLLLTIGDCKV